MFRVAADLARGLQAFFILDPFHPMAWCSVWVGSQAPIHDGIRPQTPLLVEYFRCGASPVGYGWTLWMKNTPVIAQDIRAKFGHG